MSEPETASSALERRWWESYLVRYLIGTPIGVICVLAIIHRMLYGLPQFEKLHALLLDPTAGHVSLNAASAVVLGVLGLVYCYIASAPISIIHATRMFRGEWFNRAPRYSWLLLFAVIAGVVYRLGMLSQPGEPIRSAQQLADISILLLAFPALWIVFAQVLCIMRLHLDEPLVGGTIVSKLYRRVCLLVVRFGREDFEPKELGQYTDFYWRVAIERDKHVGLRETYTHLREHSNSVFIVLFEISLASLMVWTLSHMPNDAFVRAIAAVLVLFLWLLPNVFLWNQANRLERSLISRP